ncbi:MAG: virulence factor [Nitriliruptoraceae bacterium]
MTISWRDIPAQVVASDGQSTEKLLLPGRFQRAIDRAARVAGAEELDAYVAQWRRQEEPLEGPVAEAAARRVAELDRAHPRQRLFDLVAAGGHDPAGASDVDGSAPTPSDPAGGSP